jgi:hypothetical protein
MQQILLFVLHQQYDDAALNDAVKTAPRTSWKVTRKIITTWSLALATQKTIRWILMADPMKTSILTYQG